MMNFQLDRMSTPLGEITFSADEDGNLRTLDWVDEGRSEIFSLDRFYKNVSIEEKRAPAQLRHAIKGYFEGDVSAIDDIPIALPGTDFQKRVWNCLCDIPVGSVCSYGDIAKKLKNPGAVRAVGMANNANPIAIVVPCHRVIGASGKMVGYGSGIKRKEWLLKHEGVGNGIGGGQGELKL